MAAPTSSEPCQPPRGHTYPRGTFVVVIIDGAALHGQLVIQEKYMGPERVLWTCPHDHSSGEEAAACAGREIGRDGKH